MSVQKVVQLRIINATIHKTTSVPQAPYSWEIYRIPHNPIYRQSVLMSSLEIQQCPILSISRFFVSEFTSQVLGATAHAPKVTNIPLQNPTFEFTVIVLTENIIVKRCNSVN